MAELTLDDASINTMRFLSVDAVQHANSGHPGQDPGKAGKWPAGNVARELVMFVKRPGGQSQFSVPLAAQIAERSAIRDVQNRVLENLVQPLSVEQLAGRAGMSVRNFTRNFRRETQTMPAEFVERARLDTARRLLEDTRQPMKWNCEHGGL
jgi:transcriptional regulator GlxA family with amidase domain